MGFKFYQKWRGKLSKDNLMILILVGLLLVVVSWPGKEKEGKEYAISEITTRERMEDTTIEPNSLEYGTYLEQSLENLLMKMDGVGEVEVMITFYDLGEKETLPKVEGMVIAANGAGIGKVSGEIVKVVETLFDLEAHKIKVVKLNK